MNWSKAKTILIIAFLVLNVYLVTQVLNLQEARVPVSEYTALNEKVTNLIIERYKVNPPAELPLGISPVEKTNVGFLTVERESLINALWPSNPGTWVDQGIYQYKDEFLFVDNQMFYYLNESGSKREINDEDNIRHHLSLAIEDPTNLDIVAPILRVNFEEVTALDFDGWLLESINETIEDESSYYDILFIQDMELPVYDAGSYTKIRMNKEGNIIGIKRSQLEVKETEQDFVDRLKELFDFSPKVKIISATEAILSLVVNKDLEPETSIKDIRLAYLGLSEDQLITEDALPDIWELIPVWRLKVMTPQGEIVNYYLNAYTGDIER
ncbi:MAG: two-component system regulatory protein YycI [Clostridia bacterium]